ncbi:MAG TPA: acetylglutamate kinase [Thermoanaerobaculia bacterium]|nr:acetylglutamate kinase [Thermoanaerobaculia bacterium]
MKQSNQITVVKLGGSLLEDAALRSAALAVLAARWIARDPMVVVHGGGKRIDAALGERNIPKRMHAGFRITDAATLDVVVAVLAGLVNKSLVAELSQHNVFAAGISAADGNTLSATFHRPIGDVDLGYVGEVVAADPRMIRTLVQAGYLPVISSVALGPDGTLLNLNADVAAAALAVALKASRLVFLTDVEGLMDEAGDVIDLVPASAARELLKSTTVSGGMRPKLSASLDAVCAGVGEVIIAGPRSHQQALEEGRGGTHLVAA